MILSSGNTVLAHYDPNAETQVSVDTSSYGLGTVLEQQQKDKTRQPVAYQSRSLSPCEQQYAKIEKEALAITWACKCFNSYILGKPFKIQMDYRPLIYLLSSQEDFNHLPPHIQCFRMWLMKYSFSIIHVPGKNLNCADTLSRAPKNEPKPEDYIFEEEGKLYVNQVF